MATVYIETTVPSYYHSTRNSPQAIALRDPIHMQEDSR
jgi:hypothetical protein